MTHATAITPPDALDAVDPFSFVHDGRTFTCSVEASRHAARGTWWWFAVSSEPHQRHAPFPATAGDTRDDVQTRVAAFYDALIARRNAPVQNRWHGRGGARPAATSAPAPAS